MANLIGTQNADTLNGTSENDTIPGLAGDDSLRGGSGNDSLVGGPDNDTYYFTFDDLLNDTITENPSEGVDTLQLILGGESSGVDVSLDSFEKFENVENLSLRDNTNLYAGYGNELNNKILGNNGNNELYGFTGNDSLYGYAGDDTLIGAEGNDTYHIDSVSDIITEKLNEGVDTAMTAVDWTLSDNNYVENLTLIDNSSAKSGTGNQLNNKLVGNSAGNQLDGGDSGNDSLYGLTGNDTLLGGGGNDRLVGDKGSDLFNSGPGNDILILGNNNRESGYRDSDSDYVYYNSVEGTDKIYGFVRGAGGDTIRFEGIENIDVVRDGIDTKFYDDDTNNLLVTLRRTTGFTQADVGVNLLSEGNFAF